MMINCKVRSLKTSSGERAAYVGARVATLGDPSRLMGININSPLPRVAEEYDFCLQSVATEFDQHEGLSERQYRERYELRGRPREVTCFSAKMSLSQDIQMTEKEHLECQAEWAVNCFGKNIKALCGYHADTDKKHGHVLVAITTVDGSRLRLTPKICQEFADKWAEIVSRKLQRPEIYQAYFEKANETRVYRKQYREYKENGGERPEAPVRWATEREKFYPSLRSAFCAATFDKPDWETFRKRMSDAGAQVERVYGDQTGEFCGIRLQYSDSPPIKTSELHESFNYKTIEERYFSRDGHYTTRERERRITNLVETCLKGPKEIEKEMNEQMNPARRAELLYYVEAAKVLRRKSVQQSIDKIDNVILNSRTIDPNVAQEAVHKGSPDYGLLVKDPVSRELHTITPQSSQPAAVSYENDERPTIYRDAEDGRTAPNPEPMIDKTSRETDQGLDSSQTRSAQQGFVMEHELSLESRDNSIAGFENYDEIRAREGQDAGEPSGRD